MKKTFSHLSLSVVFAFSSMLMCHSQSNSVLLFSINTRNIARVGIINNTEKTAKFSVNNSINSKLINKNIKGKESLFEFHDLSKLPDDIYVALLETDKKVVEKKFIISNGKASIYEEEESSEPRFRLTEDKVLFLSYHNKYSKTIKITIENEENILFSDETINKEIVKRYSLEELNPGKYLVKITSDNEEFKHPITIK